MTVAQHARRTTAAAPPRVVRVLIADDDPRIQSVLADLINSESSLQLVGIASGGAEAVSLCATTSPDVVLMDVRMAGVDGIDAVRQLVARGGAPAILAFSAYADSASVRAMISAGAAGYLLKGSDPETIVQALLSVSRGEGILSNKVAGDVVSEFRLAVRREEDDVAQHERKMARIRGVLSGDEGLEMKFQPVVDMKRNAIGFEALARFDGIPTRAPDIWFGEAESIGLGPDLELHAIARAMIHFDEVPNDCYLTLNVGPQLMASGRLDAALDGRDLSRIVVEITEHAFIDDYAPLLAHVDALRHAGMRIAIDDAGAGFASLRHILRMDPDIIKIDVTIVRGIDRDPTARALARALSSFGTEIGATILGEGVETVEELEMLSALGVTCAQGYLTGRPMSSTVAFGSPDLWERGEGGSEASVA